LTSTFAAGCCAGRTGDDRAQLRLDLGRIFLRHNAAVQSEGHAIRHHIGVDSARYEPDRHLWRAYSGDSRSARLKPAAPAIKGRKDRVRRFESIDAGRGTGGVRRAAEGLDFEVKGAVVRVDNRVREPSADRQIRTREAVLEQIARADLAAASSS
jgi:hypothetical protein